MNGIMPWLIVIGFATFTCILATAVETYERYTHHKKTTKDQNK